MPAPAPAAANVQVLLADQSARASAVGSLPNIIGVKCFITSAHVFVVHVLYMYTYVGVGGGVAGVDTHEASGRGVDTPPHPPVGKKVHINRRKHGKYVFLKT